MENIKEIAAKLCDEDEALDKALDALGKGTEEEAKTVLSEE